MEFIKNYDGFGKVTEWRLIDGLAVKISTVVVHTFTLGDVEDPDLYAAGPLWDWQQSEAGKWIMENAEETPSWNRMPDMMSYGYRFYISARLTEQNHTFWMLKYKAVE